MSAYSSLVLDSAPLLYWPLDDAPLGAPFVTATDISGNARHGSQTGPSMETAPGLVRGHDRGLLTSSTVVSNRRLRWDGAALGAAAGGRTWECWLRFTASTATVSYPFIWCVDSSSGTVDCVGLYYSSSTRQFIFRLGHYTSRDLPGPALTAHPTGLVHAICVQAANGVATVYINGVLYTTGLTPWSAYPTVDHISVGGAGSGTSHYIGQVGHMAVYPSAFNAEKVAAHYAEGLRRVSGSAAGYDKVFLTDADTLQVVGQATPGVGGAYRIDAPLTMRAYATAVREGHQPITYGPVEL